MKASFLKGASYGGYSEMIRKTKMWESSSQYLPSKKCWGDGAGGDIVRRTTDYTG